MMKLLTIVKAYLLIITIYTVCLLFVAEKKNAKKNFFGKKYIKP